MPRCVAGIVGSGKGQSQLVLSAGESYYTSVRAVTGAGGILESTSDGFVVDVTAPSVVVTSVAATTFNTTDSQAVVLYQKESESYTAAWQVNDQESGIADVWFHLGTYPGRQAFLSVMKPVAYIGWGHCFFLGMQPVAPLHGNLVN